MARSLKTKTSMDERILSLVEPVADDMGYDIVRVRVQGGKRATLQIMAERKSDGRMEIEDCTALSRAVSSTLEVEDPIVEAYILEVSSPGMERPLTTLADFERFEGFLARVELDRLVEGRKRFRGTLDGVEGSHIAIVLDGEEDAAQISFDWVSEAKLLVTDELIKAGPDAFARPDTPDTTQDTGKTTKTET